MIYLIKRLTEVQKYGIGLSFRFQGVYEIR